MDEVRLDRLTAGAVGDGHYDKAILPLGATEFHGPHLPYGTDTIAADVLAGAFAKALGRTLVLPPLQFGVSYHHLAFAWTISVRPETLSLVIRDVGDSLVRHGIRKFLLVSAHDGNAPVANAAARQLSQDHGLSVAVFAGWQRKARAALAGRTAIDLDHAGQSETSLVLYAAPQLVRFNLASTQRNERSDHPVDLVGSYADIAPLGYSGDAAGATRAQGEAIVASLVGLVVPYLRLLDSHGWKGGSWLSEIE
ncbi:MAG TPA: creatininase family protein [bacterium]|nr:creatininase family protein [bacterium]